MVVLRGPEGGFFLPWQIVWNSTFLSSPAALEGRGVVRGLGECQDSIQACWAGTGAPVPLL